ncbi:hypothetical protein F5I97DRAFT_1951604 [Phlebopus sp. FC_14]|nr:hypothetical protein F5I97DRAFT_1951604 [Phlebopus sp. FC_14]
MSAETSQANDESVGGVEQLQRELLLVVFIHGFKGTDSTFENFPSRLQHVLSDSLQNMSIQVECVVFPAYETKGELNAAVVRFADWLTTLTVHKEVAHGGAGKVRVVLCGHSMGGLLAADALLDFLNSRPDGDAPLWPRIIACIAFDTPYLGLHPFVFKNSANKAVAYAKTAHTVVSDVFSLFGASESAASSTPPSSLPQITTAEAPAKSGWGRWAPAAFAVGGAVVAGAAGAAYMRRDDISSGYSWAFDHMKYVRNLWDEGAMRKRLDGLLDAHATHGIIFKTFYVFLPASPPAHSDSRTFIILPARSSPAAAHYLSAANCIATDEIQAHTGMFEPRNNDGYYQLGLATARAIQEAVVKSGASRASMTNTDPTDSTHTSQ